ncbi:MAG: lipoyl synthase [Candidatus Coatesbacteria bacterium]
MALVRPVPQPEASAMGPRRLPAWLKQSRAGGANFDRVASLVRDLGLHTVCDEARCPNRHECWGQGVATFMILGSTCTRACGFCATSTGRPEAPDPGEPGRLAGAVAALRLSHVAVTSVTRDDLPDGGAAHFAACIRAISGRTPGVAVEVLTSDFGGDGCALAAVLEAAPAVFSHNLECVRRLSATVRPQADYDRSLGVLWRAGELAPAILTKSGLMLGLGERDDEVEEALHDLRAAGVSLLTLGQYLQPRPECLSVDRFVTPEEFDRWREVGLRLGFAHVASSPFTRSSHKAAESYQQAKGRSA